MMSNVCEEYRHEIDRAEQPNPKAETQRATNCKREVLQCRQLDHRMLGLECSDRKGSCRGNTQQEQDGAEWRKPAIERRLLQADLQARKRDRHQRQRISVEGSQTATT